jgi:hypothetical protein
MRTYTLCLHTMLTRVFFIGVLAMNVVPTTAFAFDLQDRNNNARGFPYASSSQLEGSQQEQRRFVPNPDFRSDKQNRRQDGVSKKSQQRKNKAPHSAGESVLNAVMKLLIAPR